MNRSLPLIAGLSLLLGMMLVSWNQETVSDMDVLKIAEASEHKTLFSEDFEGSNPHSFVQWYGGKVPFTVRERTVTDEEAHSGTHSFKLTIEPTKLSAYGGSVYFWIPVMLPRWSELTVSMYVKSKPADRSAAGVGFAHPTGNTRDNVMKWPKINTEEDGWEQFRGRVPATSDPADYVQGLSLYCDLPYDETITYYVDDVTVTGRLPANYAELHARIKQPIDDQREYGRKHKTHPLYARRLRDLTRRFYALRQRFDPVDEAGQRESFAAAQRRKVAEHIAQEFERLTPLINRQVQSYREDDKIDYGEINPLERAVGPLGVYVNSWVAFEEYIALYGTDPYLVYTLDPTFSYRILPGGPLGHKEELSYYRGGGYVGLESPQILPDCSVVPALPSRSLQAFGCRGQYIPLSFAVQTAEPLPELRFEVSQLRDGDRTLPTETVDLRVVKAWWVPFADLRFMNELLLHDDEFVTANSGDPVNHFKETKYPNDLPKLTPVSIPAGQTRQLWVTVHVPDEAEAGRYSGTIKVSSANRDQFNITLSLKVLPFDLEPTPFAYSVFHPCQLGEEKSLGQEGINTRLKTTEQMQREFINQAQHGLNTLCTYSGGISETDEGWDFSRLELVLEMATQAGLTRSPFIWLSSHPVNFLPHQEAETMEELIEETQERAPAISRFLTANGYPQAAYYGADERSGEELIRLKAGYQAVNDAGGLVAAACFPNYFGEIGEALSLPIVFGGAQTEVGERSVRASQAAGCECWIFGCPHTSMTASPAVYRRRYGLVMWRNGEDGAMPWAYSDYQTIPPGKPYLAKPRGHRYTMVHPTWEGTPIDTIIYEAFREGIYDTRYLATLLKCRDLAEAEGKDEELISRVDEWLGTFSVNDDLQQVRWQMVCWILRLRAALNH